MGLKEDLTLLDGGMKERGGHRSLLCPFSDHSGSYPDI